MVSFNGAIDSGFGDKKVTTWIKFILWGKRGSGVFPYLKKGGKVVCTGELTNRKWDGQRRPGSLLARTERQCARPR